MIRLVRLVKLYKAFKTKRKPALNKSSTIIPMKSAPKSKTLQNTQQFPNLARESKIIDSSTKDRFSNEAEDEDDDFNYDPNKESRVGKKLSDLTTKRVIIMVLLLVVFTPFFAADYWVDPIQAYEIGMREMKAFEVANTTKTNASFNKLFNSFWDFNKGLTRYPIVYFSYPARNITQKTGSPVSDLRKDEQLAMKMTVTGSNQMESIVDYREFTRTSAIINIVRTIYISLILTMGALMFSKDADKLALRPIERMIEKVNRIAKDPLSSKGEAMIKSKEQQQYETTIIENAIIKIGTLLALGFGDAGSEIIAQNISQGGDVNPMIPGKKTYAIFGFCDIRNFTDSTEVLQEDVMVFVNVIGHFVHKIVDKYGGAANKNIGDAFLLVWRAEEEKGEGKVGRKLKNMADLSLISFLKIISAINRKKAILDYRENEKLNTRIPNYKVKMGFGLHIGWAIEGAIGSIYKIDASYLSPNVNMASRLEAATKQYGVPLLVSGDLHSKLSCKTQKMCREIDCVTVKGSVRPVSLFTFDVEISGLQPSETKDYTKQEQAFNHKIAKKRIELSFIEGNEKANSLFSTDEDLERISKQCFSPLNTIFKEGYQLYVKGDWPACKAKMEECLNMNPTDGPTNALYQVLKETQFMAPPTWKGYRELTEK